MNRFVLYSSLWLLDMYTLAQLAPSGRLPLAFGSCYIAGFFLMILMLRSCPKKWSDRKVFLAAFGIGILGRLFFLGSPVSNDVFRYIWEGYIQNHGFNPYIYAPDNPMLSNLREGELGRVWESINHKDLSAAYPPLVMLFFRGLSAISPSPLFFQSTMLVFDLIIIFFVLLFIRNQGLAPARLLLYTANPFILVYTIGEAHLDVIQAAFVTGGLYCLYCKKNWSGFLLLGSAVFSKYLAIVIIPFLICRANLRFLPAAILPAMSFIPFINDLEAMFYSLGVFGTTMHYNDGLAEISRFLVGDLSVLLLVCLLLLILAIIYLFEHERMRSVYLAIGALLLMLPTLHPWYLILIAPLIVIYPSRAWIYLMGAVIVTLPVAAIEYQTGVFQEIKILKLIEYLPFFLLLVIDTVSRRAYFVEKTTRYHQVKSVTVIVPTLNESKQIKQTLSMLKEHEPISEIIVVDGGSDDNTGKIAQAAGAAVMTSKSGRGRQIAKGVSAAKGDVIVALHADTMLDRSAVHRMVECLNTHRQIPGGSFGMEFSSGSVRLKIISLLNNLRARWCGISFGDQAQFFRRDALDDLGGFPAMMLMEDVELSMRLKKLGRPLYIPAGVRVSERGWIKKGFSGNIWLVLSLFFKYLLERRFNGAEQSGDNYYRRYYR